MHPSRLIAYCNFGHLRLSFSLSPPSHPPLHPFFHFFTPIRSNVIVWLVLVALLATLGAVVINPYTWLVTATASTLGAMLGLLAAIAVSRK